MKKGTKVGGVVVLKLRCLAVTCRGGKGRSGFVRELSVTVGLESKQNIGYRSVSSRATQTSKGYLVQPR